MKNSDTFKSTKTFFKMVFQKNPEFFWCFQEL